MDRNAIAECYAMADISGMEAGIARACERSRTRYALAGFSAGARLAPNVRYSRATAFIDGNVMNVAEELGAREVTSGANLWLFTPYDAGVFYDSRTVDGVSVTSPIQTYLDLRQIKGRGNLARFDYWLGTFRYLRAVAELGCARGSLDAVMEKIQQEEDPKQKMILAESEALPLRQHMSGLWEGRTGVCDSISPKLAFLPVQQEILLFLTCPKSSAVSVERLANL